MPSPSTARPSGVPVLDSAEPTYDLVVVGAGVSGLAAAWFYRKAAASGPHPPARQPRRLRRPRQAQRVRGRGPHCCSAMAARRRWRRPAATAPPRACSATSASISSDSRRPTTRASIAATARRGDLLRCRQLRGRSRGASSEPGSSRPGSRSAATSPTTVRRHRGLPDRRGGALPVRSSTAGEKRAGAFRSGGNGIPAQTQATSSCCRARRRSPAGAEVLRRDARPARLRRDRRYSRRVCRLLRPAQPRRTRAADLGEPYIHHFPDGNASVARLLVRAPVPDALPGTTMEDVVTSRARLRPARHRRGADSATSLSTVVRVATRRSACDREGDRDRLRPRRPS